MMKKSPSRPASIGTSQKKSTRGVNQTSEFPITIAPAVPPAPIRP